MKSKRLIALFCILALSVSLFAGCGEQKTEATASPEPTVEATATPEATQKPKATKKPSVPIPSPDAWDYEYEVISEDEKTAVLRQIIVPEGINNKKVTEIVFPSTIHGYTVTTIGWDVFGQIHVGGFADDCWVSKVTIPATVTTLENDVFRTCLQLSEIVFEDESKITYLYDRTFRRTDWEKMRALQNNGICMIGSVVAGIFAGGDVVIPDGATMISGRPFQDTGYGEDLTSITIPASVTNIGGNAQMLFDTGDHSVQGVVIKCYAGSYAEKFAKDNNYAYEIIG